MSRFDPDTYRQFRVSYPAVLFQPLRPLVFSLPSGLRRVADLGAGTGISSESFLRAFSTVEELVLVDPDPRMLEREGVSAAFPRVRVSRICSPAEELRLAPPVDAVLIGSAWHWMSASRMCDRLARMLRPGGLVAIFEYQFPRPVGGRDPVGLREWVRRQFNLLWRAPGQIPRGTLDELLGDLRKHPDFFLRGASSVVETAHLSVEDFSGVIASQSRYLAFLEDLDPGEREQARTRLIRHLREYWGEETLLPFEYRYEARFFQGRIL